MRCIGVLALLVLAICHGQLHAADQPQTDDPMPKKPQAGGTPTLDPIPKFRRNLDDFLFTPWDGKAPDLPDVGVALWKACSNLERAGDETKKLLRSLSLSCADPEPSALVLPKGMLPHLGAPSAPPQPRQPPVIPYIEARIKGELADWLLNQTLAAVCEGSGLEYFPGLCQLKGAQLYTVEGINPKVQRELREDLMVLPGYAIAKYDGGSTWGYVLTKAIKRATDAKQQDLDPRYVFAGLGDQSDLKSDCESSRSHACTLWTVGMLMQAYIAAKDVLDKAPATGWKQFSARVLEIYIRNNPQPDTSTLEKLEWISGQLNLLITDAKHAQKTADDLKDYNNRVETAWNEIASINANDTAALAAARAATLQNLAAYMYVLGQAVSANAARRFGNENFAGRVYLVYKTVQIVSQVYAPDASVGFRAAGELLLCYGITPPTRDLKPDGLCPEALPMTIDDDARKFIVRVGKKLIFVTDLAEQFADTGNDNVKDLGARWGDVGFYKTKRRYERHSIGMLAGFGLGREQSKNAMLENSSKTLGLAAPVGVDFVLPIGGFGVFVSVLDFGNLLSAQVGNHSNGQVSSTETNSSLSQLQSYGAYVRYWCGSTPFVIFAGAAYAPNLRTANLANGSSEKLSSVRATVGIALELPFLLF